MPPSPEPTLYQTNQLFLPDREGLTIERVIEPPARERAAYFVDRHHSYISWADRPSRKLYWNLYEEDRFVGVFGLGSCFSHPGPVKRYMEEHALEFNEIGHNIVYCLNGHTDRNAGSRFLSLCRRDAAKWWRERYGDELRAFQTFILPPRTGAVYKADNWQLIGTTKGQTWQTRAIASSDYKLLPNTRKQTFADGTTCYFQNVYQETEPKLIYMRFA